MAITRIGANAANGASVSIPAHQAGDILIIAVYRNDATSSPTMPAGWTSLATRNGGTSRLDIRMKVAASDAEVSGTWTNATQLLVVVFRPTTYVNFYSRSAGTGANSATINYAAIAAIAGAGETSRFFAFAGIKTNDTDIEVAPTGMTHVTGVVGESAGELVMHDTEIEQDEWTLQSYVLTVGTTAQYHSFVIELIDSGVALPSGGGGVIVIED